MKKNKIVVAAISIVLCLSVAQVAVALPKLPGGMITEDKLRGWCNDQGGLFFAKDVPSSGSVYACLLPDGTLVSCGGIIPICTITQRSQPVDNLWGFETIISAMDQQTQTLKSMEDRVKILENKVREMEKTLKQR